MNTTVTGTTRNVPHHPVAAADMGSGPAAARHPGMTFHNQRIMRAALSAMLTIIL